MLKDNMKISLLVAIITSTIVLFGTTTIMAQTTVTLWSLGPREGVEELVETFEEKNPDIKIDYTIQPGWADIWQQFLVQSAAGNPPDIIRGKEWWVKPFADKGALLSLDDYVEQNKDEIYGDPEVNEVYNKRINEVLTYEGEIYGLPHHNFWPVLVYHNDMLEEAGYDEPPETLSELKEISAKITDPDEGVFGHTLYDYERIEPVLDLFSFRPYYLQFGGEVVEVDSETGEPTFTLDKEENIEAMEWIVDGMYGEPQYIAQPEQISEEMQVNKNVAMWITGQFSFGGYDEDMPSDADWRVAPLPEHKTSGIFTEGNAWMISKQTNKPDAAFEVAKFLTGKEADLIWSSHSGTMPFRDSNWDEPPYNEEERYIQSRKAIEEAEVHFPRYFPEYSETFSEVANHLQEAFYQEKTPREALEAAQETAIEEAGY